MLTKVEVRTDLGALLTLPLQDVAEGFIVEDIQGLDPVKATIVTSNFSQLDGEEFQSARRDKRNMIITLVLEPDYSIGSVEALRQRLYEFFMPKSRVNLRFYSTNKPTLDISGRIESFDSPQFTQEPKATISILNFDPDFHTATPIVLSGNADSTAIDTLYTYPGTVETGFLFKLNVNRNISDFTIYHRPADNVQRMLEFKSLYPMISGDVLHISTIQGNKYATLFRSGVATSLLYGVSPQSNWINLYPGPNYFRVTLQGAAIPYTIEYTTKYGAL